MIPTLQEIAAGCLVEFFLFVLPANIYASMKHLNYETGASDGKAMKYLWFGIPLQVFFIQWVYWSALR